jgi:HSP20 family protein
MSTTMTETKKEGKREEGLALETRLGVGLPLLNRLRKEFDELWNKFFTEMPALWGAERTDLRWGFEVEDEAEAYVVKAEAPGFDPSDFNIELRGEQLVLRAKKSEKKKEKEEETFTASEFYHAMTLPPYVDVDRIEATYKQGVLTVTLPKTEEGRGRKIPVKG